jgi:hypothetical protein
MKACQKLLPNGGPGNQTPEERAKFRDAALKFAQCMRSHGVNIPDPQPGNGGIRIGGPGSGVDPNSPTFQNAQKTCEKLLPKRPGGGGPGKGPS